MPTPCYLIEPRDEMRRFLRRYVSASHDGWTCEGAWHQARVEVERAPAESYMDADRRYYRNGDPADFAGDARWPTTCEKCEYAFLEEDKRQVFTELVYRVVGIVPGAHLGMGDETTIRDAPAGAMWWCEWASEWWRGFDGRALAVKLPGGHDWLVDSEASNCTRNGDRTHRCWIRHGEPPYVTVDKSGETCQAGAGSIMAGDYHGFLRDGVLT